MASCDTAKWASCSERPTMPAPTARCSGVLPFSSYHFMSVPFMGPTSEMSNPNDLCPAYPQRRVADVLHTRRFGLYGLACFVERLMICRHDSLIHVAFLRIHLRVQRSGMQVEKALHNLPCSRTPYLADIVDWKCSVAVSLQSASRLGLHTKGNVVCALTIAHQKVLECRQRYHLLLYGGQRS